MEALTQQQLKEWRNFHIRRGRDPEVTDAQRAFHLEAAQGVQMRIAMMKLAEKKKWDEPFDWSSFCALYRPKGMVIIV